MARYIDADSFIEKLKVSKEYQEKYATFREVKMTEFFIESVKEQPTADVVEVKHGCWTGRLFDWGSEEEYPILEKSHYLVCSECGYKHFLYIYDFFGKLHKCSTSDIPIIIPNGCPNCLAKMDGGKAE